MDIQNWLDETVKTDAPPGPANTSGPNFCHCPKKPELVFDQQCAPKRVKSDSSLLVPQPCSRKALRKQSKLPNEDSSDVGAYSEAPRLSCNGSSGSESSSQRYARKPRHKTRLERYEPKQDTERGKHLHRRSKGESKKSRRKSKRKTGDKSGSGVAQSFNAKNVSRDRLTLKPREQLGIFNKGKTSAAVRGRGLPDLVFSEMRFLQKEKNQPEPATQQSATKKKRKKDHAQTKEGEISSFFTFVRPALAEQDQNVRIDKVQEDDDETPMIGHRKRERLQKSSGVVPTIEIPNHEALLGSGSRGLYHESASSVSWADSIRASDMMLQCPQHIPTADVNPQQYSKRYVGSIGTGKEETEPKHPAPPSVINHKREASAERFRISSITPSQYRASKSHSSPQQTPSRCKVNLANRTAKVRSVESVASPSPTPPCIFAQPRVEPRRLEPSIDSRFAEDAKTSHPTVNDTLPPSPNDIRLEDQEIDAQQRTSSDLGMVIQQCNQVFHEQRRAIEPHQSYIPKTAPTTNDTERYVHPTEPHTTHRRPVVRFLEVEMPSSSVPNFSGPSIYAQQAQSQRAPLQVPHFEDDFLEDAYLAEQELGHEQKDMLYNEQIWEEDFEEPMLFDSDTNGGIYSKEEPRAAEGMVQRFTVNNDVVAPGFWRPNRLY